MGIATLILAGIAVLLLIIVLILTLVFRQKNSETPVSDTTGNPINDLYVKLGTLENQMKSLSDTLGKDITVAQESQKLSLTLAVQEEMQKTQGSNQVSLDKINTTLNDRLNDSNKTTHDFLTGVQTVIATQIAAINATVGKTVKDGYADSSEQVKKVTESLTKIEDAQTKLEDLSKEIGHLHDVLSNNGSLGQFGERILGDILRAVFGQQATCYGEQVTFHDDTDPDKRVRADAVIYLPEPVKMLAIDSKFSFIKYRNLFDNTVQENEADLKKDLKVALRQEIDKIADSYIIPGKTADYALMFIPNDGIYVAIESDPDFYENVVSYAAAKKVILASPSILQPILANLNLFRMRISAEDGIKEILRNAEIIRASLANYQSSWDELAKDIDRLTVKKDDFQKKVKTLNQKLDRIPNPDDPSLKDGSAPQ